MDREGFIDMFNHTVQLLVDLYMIYVNVCYTVLTMSIV